MRHLTVLTLLIAVVCLLGCDREKAPDSDANKETASDTADAGDDPIPEIRSAFGIPLPPEGAIEQETEHLLVWRTEMSVEELETYYQGRLTDYEVLREGLTIRIVGLRSGMASAFGSHQGVEFNDVSISYTPGVPPDTLVYLTPRELDGTVSVPDEDAPPPPAPPANREELRRGKEVTLRLRDGTLMAPGARWGEPYTPPKGSYFDKKSFKKNWGRPFGDWRAF